MPEEVKKEAAAVEKKAEEAIESAEAKAAKEAEEAAKKAKEIAKKNGEEEAQKWLDGKLATINQNLETRLSAIQNWFQEQMATFQQKIYETTKELLEGKKKESSTPPNSTPAQNPEKAAENNGSPSETSEVKNPAPAKKRRRI